MSDPTPGQEGSRRRAEDEARVGSLPIELTELFGLDPGDAAAQPILAAEAALEVGPEVDVPDVGAHPGPELPGALGSTTGAVPPSALPAAVPPAAVPGNASASDASPLPVVPPTSPRAEPRSAGSGSSGPRDAADAVAPPRARIRTRIEAPSPDVATPEAPATLPGAHRGGYTRPPTAPLEVSARHPDVETVTDAVVTPPSPPANLAAIALGFAVVGLIASLVVGLALPIGVTGVVLGVLSTRRRSESTPVAVWAIALGVLSVVYSIGWLWWAASQAGLLGP